MFVDWKGIFKFSSQHVSTARQVREQKTSHLKLVLESYPLFFTYTTFQ